MINDAPSHIAAAEERCRWYREILAQGHHWPAVPLQITEHWLTLLHRPEISAEDLADLLRRCDEYRDADFDPPFFAMCDTIRSLYRTFYTSDISQAVEAHKR